MGVGEVKWKEGHSERSAERRESLGEAKVG